MRAALSLHTACSVHRGERPFLEWDVKRGAGGKNFTVNTGLDGLSLSVLRRGAGEISIKPNFTMRTYKLCQTTLTVLLVRNLFNDVLSTVQIIQRVM